MEKQNPEIAVLGIGTAVPPNRLDQEETAKRLSEALSGHKEAARWARRIFKFCGVDTRYTCEPNLLEPAHRCRYYPFDQSHRDVPMTAERMAAYKRHSVPLALEAASKALSDSEMNVSDITHLITVSCTGLFLPGLDVALIQKLGLAVNVNRIPLTFLGCAAGLTAVRLSRQIVEGNPSAKVLIVCVELCTLHIQPSFAREDLFAAAFFGDGASACVVGETDSQVHKGGFFALGSNHSVVLPSSADEMVWNIGNYGFNLYLSPNIPKLIGYFVPAEIERLLDGGPLPDLWAIHPGGRGIIDALQTVYHLTDAQTRASRSILRRFGNLSSATILFVLQALSQELENMVREPKDGIALAFGPGLNAELMRITYIPPSSATSDEANV